MKLLSSCSLLLIAHLSSAQRIGLTNDDGWAVSMIRAQNDALKEAGYDVTILVDTKSFLNLMHPHR